MPRKDLSPVADWFRSKLIPVIWQSDADVTVLERASVLFLQGLELSELPPILHWLKSGPLHRIPALVHIDLLGGLTSDEAGLRYLAGMGGIDGVITVRPHVVAAARRLKLKSILLLFLQDGRSIERGFHVLEQFKPDAVELVPGVAALETAQRFAQLPMPRIAGGLIRTPELVRQLLEAGFNAVSSSDRALWSLNRPRM